MTKLLALRDDKAEYFAAEKLLLRKRSVRSCCAQTKRSTSASQLIATKGPLMRKLFLYATIASGAVAAYLMYRRGESFGTIAKNAGLHPVGSLVHELKRA
jgi:hypothetical protein